MEPFVQRLITGVTLLGGAATCFGIGYSLGKDTNEGTVSFIREKHQTLEKSESRLQAENTALKLEISRSPPTSPSVLLAGSASSFASASAALDTSSKPSNAVARIKLQQGKSAEVFNGEVSISLVAVSFGGEPLRYTVLANIGAPGKENQTMNKADVGYAITYEGYEIRLTAADTLTAEFQVTEFKPKAR